MYILAFHDGHDPAACLLKDGEVVAAVEEERFNRIKHSPGKPPWESIRYCLSTANITLDQVDEIVYASCSVPRYFFRICFYYLTHWSIHSEHRHVAYHYVKKAFYRLGKYVLGRHFHQGIFKEFGAHKRRIRYVDHHISHGASAFYFSGFDEASIVTWDGKGDGASVVVAEGLLNGDMRTIRRYDPSRSLGYAYASVTSFLGFEVNEGEYKVMGLAPYGNPVLPFDDLISVDDRGNLHIQPPLANYNRSQSFLEKRFGIPRRKPDEPVEQIHRDIAASLQAQFERCAIALVKYAIERTGKRKVCLAGGVSLNVKMNKAIRESGIVDELFVQPVAGDAGTPLGAAAYVYHQLTGKKAKPFKHLYFGPSSTPERIESAIRSQGLSFEKPENIAATVADLLVDGKVVGWFQGRMEYGPRALGSRSILADARRSEMKDIVNEKIKFREPFRPFCPSVLSEDMGVYLHNPTAAPFMIVAFDVKHEKAAEIPAVVHVDGTARPQEVTRPENPLYYDMIHAFKKKTGVGVIMDTSLNRRGEPIAAKPEEAIDIYLKTDLDALALGPYLLTKKIEQRSHEQEA